MESSESPPQIPTSGFLRLHLQKAQFHHAVGGIGMSKMDPYVTVHIGKT